MAAVQIPRRSVRAVIETVQDERSGREGAIEVSGAGTRNNWSGRDSAENVIAVRLVGTFFFAFVLTAHADAYGPCPLLLFRFSARRGALSRQKEFQRDRNFASDPPEWR
jgi:hypothetical protein